MKKSIIIIPFLTIFFLACTKNDIPAPNANFNIYTFENFEYKIATSGVIKKPLYIKNTGNADFFAVYTGQAKHIYNDSISTGVPMIKDAYFELVYKTAGSYEITLIATNVDDYGNTVQKMQTKTIAITQP